MSNPDTEKLLRLVEEETGYRVSVGTTDKVNAGAEMLSATPGRPTHIINVSTRCLAVGDYIVAAQCSMLLAMWSHPKGVPQFSPVPEKIVHEAQKAANWKGLSKLSPAMAEEISKSLVSGLLFQLRSTPCELAAIEYCFRECPSLRGQQADAVGQSLKRNTRDLQPMIKDLSPPDIYQNSQIMNASLARFWCDLSGTETAMIPYKAIGVDIRARKFVDLWRDSRGTLGERTIQTVDDWAVELKLRSLYAWTFREKSSEA